MFKRMKQARKHFGLSSKEMADKCKISSNYYSLLESGNFKGSFTANVLAGFDGLGVSIHWLYTGEGSMLREDVVKKIQEDQEFLPEIPRVYEAIKDSHAAAVIEENEIREEAEETVKRWRKPTKEEIEEAAEEMLERRSESAWRKQYVPRIDRRGCACRRGKRIGRILRIVELIDTIMGRER